MYCPISGKLLLDPVLASDFNVYDRLTILGYKKEGYIELPGGGRLEVEVFEDKITKTKVENFLKENPGFIMPASKEGQKRFIEALESKDMLTIKEVVNNEPTLLSLELLGKMCALQLLAHSSDQDNIQKLSCLLKLAKTKCVSVWHDFFERHIASKGKASVIIKLIQEKVLDVNDQSFAKENTLLHLAAKHDHKGLIKKLIFKCDADTCLTNEKNDKAKNMGPPRSGVAKLIKESVQKKVFMQMLKPTEEKFSKKVKKLKEKNGSLERGMESAKKTNESLKNELNNTRKYAETLEKNLKLAEFKIAYLDAEKCGMDLRIARLQEAHNNYVRLGQEKGFFGVSGFRSYFLSSPDVSRKKEKNDYESCVL